MKDDESKGSSRGDKEPGTNEAGKASKTARLANDSASDEDMLREAKRQVSYPVGRKRSKGRTGKVGAPAAATTTTPPGNRDWKESPNSQDSAILREEQRQIAYPACRKQREGQTKSPPGNFANKSAAAATAGTSSPNDASAPNTRGSMEHQLPGNDSAILREAKQQIAFPKTYRKGRRDDAKRVEANDEGAHNRRSVPTAAVGAPPPFPTANLEGTTVPFGTNDGTAHEPGAWAEGANSGSSANTNRGQRKLAKLAIYTGRDESKEEEVVVDSFEATENIGKAGTDPMNSAANTINSNNDDIALPPNVKASLYRGLRRTGEERDSEAESTLGNTETRCIAAPTSPTVQDLPAKNLVDRYVEDASTTDAMPAAQPAAPSLPGAIRGGLSSMQQPSSEAVLGPGFREADNFEVQETKEEEQEIELGRHSNTSTKSLDAASNAMPTNSKHGLVEATPIVGESIRNFGEAEAVDLDALERKQQNRKKRNILWALGLVFAALACIVGVVIAVVLTRGNSRSAASPVGEATASPRPTTMSPSMVPSAAPTMILEDLPDYTMERLVDPFSPQYDAYVWLSNHQNLTNLPGWRKKQLFALAVIYYSMKGTEWPRSVSQDWLLDDRSECDWYSESYREEYTEGIDENAFGLYPCYTCERSTCDGEGRFRTLRLTSLNVNGTKIPPEIALLTSLVTISLPNCNIGGHFISELGMLSALVDLDLAANSLIGNIPSEIGLMTSMTKLLMNENNLSGTLPPEIGLLSKLGWFVADGNSLNGTLPGESIGRMTTLYELGLSNNALTGTIPTELGQVTWLGLLGLDSNELSGSLPSELGLLDPPIRTNINGILMIPPNSNDDQSYNRRELYSFDTQRNLSWVNREWVLSLNLTNNNFSGSLPFELVELARNSSFMRLYIGNNSFSGVIPDDFCFVSGFEFDCSEQFCGCHCICSMTLPPNFDPLARTTDVGSYLIEHALSLEEDLEREESPQKQALDFLSAEDALFLDVPNAGMASPEGYRFATRYALVVLYFSTNRPDWFSDFNFIQPADHCRWYLDPDNVERACWRILIPMAIREWESPLMIDDA